MKKLVYFFLLCSFAFPQLYENFEDLSDWNISGGGNWSSVSSNYCYEGQCQSIYFPNNDSGEDAVISRSVTVSNGAILNMYLYGYWAFNVKVLLDDTVIYDNAVNGNEWVNHTINLSGEVNLSIISQFATLGSGYIDELNITGVHNGPTWHVSTTGSDDNDGSIEYPFATIQKGIDNSSEGDTVLVEAGIYYENLNLNGKSISLLGEARENTIIDGGQNGTVVTYHNEETMLSVLSGFTIQNGNSGGAGGIDCINSHPRIEDIIVKDNIGGFGGGIRIFDQNFSSDDSTIVKNVIVKGNQAGQGGGMWIRTSKATIIDSLELTNNSTNVYSSGIYFENFNDYVIKNSTIVQNIGGPALFFNNARGLIQNSILRNDTSFEIEYIGNTGYYGLTIEHSNVKGGVDGFSTNLNGFEPILTNVIDLDPLFCDSENSNFTIYDNSPCIGSGIDGANMGAYGIGCYAPLYSGPSWYVSTNGSDNNDGSEGNPFATIQAGINSSSEGDTVLIEGGDYLLISSQIDISKSITLRGDVNGETNFILDQTFMNSSNSLLKISENFLDVVIENINFYHGGNDHTSYGILRNTSQGNGHLLVNNCSFRDFPYAIKVLGSYSL